MTTWLFSLFFCISPMLMTIYFHQRVNETSLINATNLSIPLIEVSKINQKKIDLPSFEILHSATNFD